MIPFRTTPEPIMTLATIMVKMEKAGLDRNFIVEASELARSDQGVYDLMALWIEAAVKYSSPNRGRDTTAEETLAGGTFKKSQNNYDWLGDGIYF